MKRVFLIGPILFAGMTVVLTLIQYDFLRNLGWHPLEASTLDWPSGLALGPHGIWMTVTFLVSGLLLSFFALCLGADLKPDPASRIGSALLACAGLALAGLAFTTDPTIRSTPATWHGRLHDLSFLLLGLTLLPSMLVLGFAFHRIARWRDLSIYTWAALAFAIPTFILKGPAFYAFLMVVLIWYEVLAVRMLRQA